MNGISLFSGAGGLDLSAKWAGIRTVCYVENDPYAQGVLMSRMRSGDLDDAPIFEDVRTFDGGRVRGHIDIVFGGFPCQPHSTAGKRGKGGGDNRNLWPDTLRILKDSKAKYFIGENVPGIFTNGYAGTIMADLEDAGYYAEAFKTSACAFGAPHPRERMFFVANSHGKRWTGLEQNQEIIGSGINSKISGPWRDDQNYSQLPMAWLRTAPRKGVLRVDDGMAEELDRLRLCGNGVVPQQAYPFFQEIVSSSKAGKENK